MENSPQLLPDYTLIYQLGIFFASYFVMRVLVFKPYLALLRLRKEKTVGLKEKAAEAQARAVQLKAEYDSFMLAERKKVASWTDEERRKVADEEKLIVQSARDTVASELDSLRKKIDAEVDRARNQLLPQVSEYSSHIAAKLVGRNVEISGVQRDGNPLPENSPTI